MLLIHRFEHLGLRPETMALIGAGLYLAIRFGAFRLLKNYTVHRGMFHSIPAALIAAQLAFLLCACEGATSHYYKAGAVLLGYMSHLILDELYAIEWKGGRWRFKKSFGTALKLWGNNRYANISTYLKVIVLAVLAIEDPVLMEKLEEKLKQGQEIPRIAIEKIDDITR